MTRLRTIARRAAVGAVLGAAALALAGCISLLPKSKPAQLYRFGQSAAAAAPGGPAGPRTVAVFRTNGGFEEAAADDRILTVTGGQAAFIADSRWVAPASVLFNEAVSNAFDAQPGRVRLLARGQQGKFAYVLRLDVRQFETVYPAPDAAPTVAVRVHAALNRADQVMVGEQEFEARVAAGDNRVSAIAAAYDRAVADVIGKLVAWTNANAKETAS
jgi:cholesterol transport system auxiliary component